MILLPLQVPLGGEEKHQVAAERVKESPNNGRLEEKIVKLIQLYGNKELAKQVKFVTDGKECRYDLSLLQQVLSSKGDGLMTIEITKDIKSHTLEVKRYTCSIYQTYVT